MGHAQFAFKKAEQQQQSSVTTLFTWRWLKQTAPHLAGNPGWCCPTLCVTPYAAASPAGLDKLQTNMQVYSRLGGTLIHVHTHTSTCADMYTCRGQIFSTVRGRGTTNVNMHSNGGAASRAGVNVTKCCQTFARTLAWQRQNANVQTQFQVCVCVNREGGNGKSKCLIAFNGPL